MSAADFARFLELDDTGWSGRQIAKELGVNERTITRWRAATGRAKREPTAAHPASDREHAAHLLAGGASLTETAATIGVTDKTIRRWFPQQHGWTKAQSGSFGQLSRRLTALGRAA